MNLLFDLDGTLANPIEGFYLSVKTAFEKNGLTPPTKEFLSTCVGPPFHISLREILKVPESLIAQVTEDYRIHHAREGLLHYTLYPTVPESIARLSQSHRLFVATSKPRVEAVALLERLGLAQYFVKIYGSETDGTRSVKSELIRYLLTQESLDLKTTVMIGDREHDIHGAKSNALKSIAVGWGFGSREEHEKAKADWTVSAWPELELRIQSISS